MNPLAISVQFSLSIKGNFMKITSFLTLIFVLCSLPAFSDDSVVCYSDSSKLDVSWNDKGTLSVSHAKYEYLDSVEVKYRGSNKYILVKPEITKIMDIPMSEIKIIYDVGTSIKKVYIIDWSKFDDGSLVPVKLYNLYPSVPNGRAEFIKSISCEAAQS